MKLRVALDKYEDCFVRLHPDDLLLLLGSGNSGSSSGSVIQVNLEILVGARAESAASRGFLRVDRKFSDCLGLELGQEVAVRRANPEIAEFPISVRPASTDDWEVVEANAQLLEHLLLSQISVLSPGMQFPIYTSPGAKPLVLTVADKISDPFRLAEGCEVAVEARPRVALAAGENFSGKFRARIKVTDEAISDFSLPVVIGNPADIKTLDSGLVKISGLKFPIILRASAALCDRGVLVTGGVLRRFLAEGERVVVEEFPGAPCFANQAILLTIGNSREAISDLRRILAETGGFVAAQEQPLEISGNFAMLKFPGPKDALFFLDQDVEISAKALPAQLHPEISRFGRFPDFLPLSLLENGKAEILQPRDHVLPPSLQVTAVALARAIDRILVFSDPTLPCVATLLTGADGKDQVLQQTLEILRPKISALALDCQRLSRKEAEAAISGFFKFATENPPLVVVLRAVEALDAASRKFLERLLFESVRPHRGLALLATAAADSPELAEIFAHHVAVPSLGLKDRVAMVGPEIAAKTEGAKFSELEKIRTGACDVNEINRREKFPIPDVLLDQLAGPLRSVVGELKKTIEFPLKFPALCKGAVELPRGALLVGGTGSGKTALVHALAHDLKLPLVSCKGAELLSKYVGASEQAVREVFLKAQSQAPAILFFDEIDALAPKRGSAAGVMDRVVNQLLTMLDGVETAATSHVVFVVAATARPEILDTALTRPGRIDKVFVCDWPECLDDLMEIFRALARNFRFDFDPAEIMTKFFETSGMPITGADIQGILNDAGLQAQKRGIETIVEADLALALQRVRATLKSEYVAYTHKKLLKYRTGKGGLLFPDQVGKDLVLQ